MQLFSRSTPFESGHDVSVVSTLRGVDLVCVISGSGDFTHLAAASTCRRMGGREGLSWKQATGMGHGAGSPAQRFEKLSLIAVPMRRFPVRY